MTAPPNPGSAPTRAPTRAASAKEPAKPKPTLPAPATPAAPATDPGSDLVDRSLREADVMDRKGYQYIIHPLMDGVPRCDPRLLAAWTDWAAAQRDVLDGATMILAPEAMGIPFGVALSLRTGLPYGILRKRRYDLPGEEVAYCEPGYGESCLHLNDTWPDDKVVIVDDTLSTGGTMDGVLNTLKTVGATCNGVLLFLDKGTARSRLQQRHGATIRAMRTVRIEGKKVVTSS